MTPLERARALAAERVASDSVARAQRTVAAPVVTAPTAAPTATATATPYDAPKLKLAIDTLEKRCDDFSRVLDRTIADMESTATSSRLGGWYAAIVRRHGVAAITLAVAGVPPAEHQPKPPAGFALKTVDHPELAASNAPQLGTLRRSTAGLVWYAPKALLAPEMLEAFAPTTLGVIVTAPEATASTIARVVPEAARRAIATIESAREFVELADAVFGEFAGEAERAMLQTAVADRTRATRATASILSARKAFLTDVRDDLGRDLQAIVDELSRFIAGLDGEALLRVPVRNAMNTVPALRVNARELVHVHDFDAERRHQWWTGTAWERMANMLPEKLRLTLPAHDLVTLASDIAAQLNGMVSKAALRRIDAFDAAIDDFAPIARDGEVELRGLTIEAEARASYDRKVDGKSIRSFSASGAPAASLIERARRVSDLTCERDFKSLVIDIERKGPIGRLMEARTAVMGISFVVMTAVRVSNVFKPVASSTVAAGGIPWNIIFNAAILGVFFIFLGLVVNAVTEEGKEDAAVTAKIHDARDGLEDKLLSVMERFVNTELANVKTSLTEAKTAVIARFDRALDGIKAELEDDERRSRSNATRTVGRSSIAALPSSFRSEVDKTAAVLADARREFGTARAASGMA